MSDLGTTPSNGGTRSVTAFFDTSEHASAARADLIAVGLPESDVNVIGSGADQFTVDPVHEGGFWEKLANFFMPDDDRRAYAEGLRRGGFAVSVRSSEALYDRVIDVLDRDGAVDLDERELTWKDEGWSPADGGVDNVVGTTTYRPADAGTAGFGGSFAGEDGIARVDEATNPDVRERIGAGTADQTAPAPTGGPHTYGQSATPADDQLADEAEGRPRATEPLPGRRDLAHGRSRVRSYIVE